MNETNNPEAFRENNPNEATLKNLGWPRIETALQERVHSEAAANLFAQTEFFTDIKRIEKELDGVEEAQAVLLSSASLDFGVGEVEAIFSRLEKGGLLDPLELLEIKRAAEITTRIFFFFKDKEELYPRLFEIAYRLSDLSALASAIARVVNAEGAIKDDASPQLYDLKTKMAELSRRIKARIDAVLSGSELNSHIQDAYCTIRNDRYVIPIKAGSQRHVSGIVHDYSSSGQTVFIEPQQIVESGNELKMTATAIKEEEARLLAMLSDFARKNLLNLRSNFAAAIKLDSFFARARLALDLELFRPRIKEGINLLSLRNPLMLLEKEPCVKNDLYLEPPRRAMIITGPNAGGKSVLLKSLGLAALMLRAGMPVCAAEGSSLFPFNPVFAAFGDAQDISLKLSTFSGHVAALKQILERGGKGSLVLLDEIGTDTDPNEGAALAISVLETLNEQGATVLVTTHYPELRALALHDERFTNASVGYDPETLGPTYRLHSGLAGRSFAIAISERLGLPAPILERAKELVGEREWRLSELARELTEQKERLEREIAFIEKEKQDLLEKAALADERIKELDKRELELSAMKHKGLLSELEAARKKVAEIIKDLQGGATLKTAVTKSEELKKLSQEESSKHKTAEKKLFARALSEGGAIPEEQITEGMRVGVPSFRASGTVLSVDKRKKRAIVDFGGLRVEVYLYELRKPGGGDKTEERKRKSKLQVEDFAPQKAYFENVDLELDLRGETVESGLDRLEAHLDKATRNNISFVRVIHGHGTGALKRAVRQALSKSRYVKSFQPCHPDQGGDGATEVTLAIND